MNNSGKIALAIGTQLATMLAAAVVLITGEAIRVMLNVPGIAIAAGFGCATVKLGDGSRLKLKGDVACTCFEARKHHRRRRLGTQT